MKVRLAVTRGLLRTLDRLAPEWAARWATRVWCTPPPPGAARQRPDPTTRPGDRFLAPLAVVDGWASRPVWRPARGWQFGVPVAGRELVVAEVWGDGPTTYLLHGWGGWRSQLAGLVEPLVAAGQRVVALDAPGHGESGSGRLGGRRTTVAELAEALTAVVAVTGPAHAVVAHSAGGNAAVVAVRDGLATDRLVLLAPLADPLPQLRHFARELGVGPRTWPRLLRRLERLVGRELADYDLLGRLARAAEGSAGSDRRWPPLLVVHDRDDRRNRHRDGQALATAWPGGGGRLLSTEGLGHRRILTDPDVINATVSFITAGPVPAAAPVRVATTAGSSGRS